MEAPESCNHLLEGRRFFVDFLLLLDNSQTLSSSRSCLAIMGDRGSSRGKGLQHVHEPTCAALSKRQSAAHFLNKLDLFSSTARERVCLRIHARQPSPNLKGNGGVVRKPVRKQTLSTITWVYGSYRTYRWVTAHMYGTTPTDRRKRRWYASMYRYV